MKTNDFLEGDVVVIEISGKIMGGDEITRFHGLLHQHLEARKTRFLIDLDKVTWSNSLGLGMFIAALASVQKAQGKMVLANVTNIEALLAMTKLVRVFDSYDSREEAMKALA
ncbi:MAG: STAS domain-containing protein [Candidatus Zixiibacteriota bacterium]